MSARATNCYLCNGVLTDENYTRDHIPPKGIFAEPLPKNLITLPCCQTCNNDNHKADEFFRSLIAMTYNRSEAGDRVWQKVRDRTIPAQRIKPELDQLTSTMKKITDPLGKPCVQMGTKRRPLNLQLIRITKGLLATFYPQINYSNFEWRVIVINQFKMKDLEFWGLLAQLHLDSRGSNGEFKFWRAIATDGSNRGFWVYMFYDGACFTVDHFPRTTNYRKSAAVTERFTNSRS